MKARGDYLYFNGKNGLYDTHGQYWKYDDYTKKLHWTASNVQKYFSSDDPKIIRKFTKLQNQIDRLKFSLD